MFHRVALCGGGWRSPRWVVRCLSFLFFTYFTRNIFICALFDPQRVMIPPAQFLTKSICRGHLEIPIFGKRVPLRHKKRSEELPTSLSCCLESAVRRSGASARTFPNTAPERERVQGKLSGPDFHKVQSSSLTNRNNQEQSNLTSDKVFSTDFHLSRRATWQG